MKNLLVAICFLALLSGCTHEYLITTTDGQILTSQGKPKLDKDTGMVRFEDEQGRSQTIPADSIKQIMER